MAEKKYCQRCGTEIGKYCIKYCRPCSAEVRQERHRIYYQNRRGKIRAERVHVKLCARCGAEFVTKQGNRKYCDECRLLPGDRQRERIAGMSPGYEAKESGDGAGGQIARAAEFGTGDPSATVRKEGGQIARAAGDGSGGPSWAPALTGAELERDPSEAEKTPEGAREFLVSRLTVQRRPVISERELLRLVKLYGPPYETYGKLKAYVDRYGKLPPRSCLRSAHPHVVDVQAFQSTPGEKWFV